MEKKATIYDYVRFKKGHNSCIFGMNCESCELGSCNNGRNENCDSFMIKYPEEANKIILKWCEEHPIETKQSRLLKMFPNAALVDCKFIKICPNDIDVESGIDCNAQSCDDCRKNYWLVEEENDGN